MTKKLTIEKIAAYLCITGVMIITNTPYVSAYEAHVMNVTANIVDDSVLIAPTGNKYCDDGSLKVELKSALSNSGIYYTIDGTDPICNKNGKAYSEPIELKKSATVKAVACHGEIQGLVMSRSYEVSDDYCDHTSLKINKVYYNPDRQHMTGAEDNENEWIELYNPTDAGIDIKGWQLCDAEGCGVLSKTSLAIPARGYMVIADKQATWSFWKVPAGALKLTMEYGFGTGIGNGLNDTADLVKIKDSSNALVDSVNWGAPKASWVNYGTDTWNPGVSTSGEGLILGRINNGVDTDKVSDWMYYTLPSITVTAPNGGEVFVVGEKAAITWTTKNPNGGNGNLKIDLYYSKDSGKTWSNIAKGIDNTGTYSWRVPLALAQDACNLCYIVPSNKARIKAVAIDTARNFMLQAEDASDKDFCPPVDKSLLTPEELALLGTLDTSAFDFVGNDEVAKAGASVQTEPNKAAGDTSALNLMTSKMLGKDDEEYLIEEGADLNEAKDAEVPDKEAVAAIEESAKEVKGEAVTAESGTKMTVTETTPVESATAVIADESEATIQFNLNA